MPIEKKLDLNIRLLKYYSDSIVSLYKIYNKKKKLKCIFHKKKAIPFNSFGKREPTPISTYFVRWKEISSDRKLKEYTETVSK